MVGALITGGSGKGEGVDCKVDDSDDGVGCDEGKDRVDDGGDGDEFDESSGVNDNGEEGRL
jgi:hypothetical protein